jgi:pyruvate dehydrogenase E1 component alpha subunit
MAIIIGTRDEVGGVRQARDPIEYVKKLLVDCGLATPDEIKGIEKEIRNAVQADLTKAKAGKTPPEDWLYMDIFSTADGRDEKQEFIRMPDYYKSIGMKV